MTVDRIASLVKYWNDEMRAGKEYKKKHAQPEKWSTYKDYYRGNWRDPNQIPVNKTFSFGRTMIPRTYFRAPVVSVTPTHPKYVWHARIVEAIDNYLIRELSLKKTLKRSILDAFYAGVGPIKLGFDSEFGYDRRVAALPGGGTVTGTSTKQERTRIEYRANIKAGMPWAVAVSPLDVITPWGLRDPEELPWIAHEYIRPLKDVQADAKYIPEARGKVKGGFVRDADDPRFNPLFPENVPQDLCLLKEVRDWKYGRILVICEDQLLLEAEDELQIENLPWEFIIFNDDPDHFWGVSDVKMVEPQQLELNQIRTQAMKHRRISMLKLLVRKGLIKEEQINKLLSEDIELLEVEDQDAGMSQVVFQLQNHVPPELWQEAQEVLNDYREIVGFSRNEAGEFKGGTPPSAHEIVAVQQASEIRTDERRDVVADVLVNIIRRWNQFIFKFWDSKRVSKVVGPDGAQYWIEYTGEELAAEYNLTVDAESGQPITRALRMQLAEKMYLANRMDPFFDPIKLREMYIKSQSWIDPGVEILMPNPQALAKLQAGETVEGGRGNGAVPPGAGPDARQQKTFGSPTQPMTVNQVMRGGA